VAAGIATGGMGVSTPIIYFLIIRFSWEMLTTHLNSITMKPRALGVSSTLAFVEHERGRGIYE